MAGFFEGGAKTLSFGERGSEQAKAVFGKWRGGMIVNIGEARQQTDFVTREPKFWPKSQDPVMQLPITLDTWGGGAGRCPEPAIDEEDDGVRDYYITKGKQDFQAARNALKKASAKDFEAGGHLYIRWVKGEGNTGDPRQFEMIYEPPTQTSAGFMEDAPPAAPPAAPAMPPQVPPAAGQPRFDPQTGQPLAPPAAETPAPRFDPATGQPLAAAPAAAPEPPRFDPQTGEPMNDAARAVLAGNTPAAAGPGPQGSGGVTNPYKR